MANGTEYNENVRVREGSEWVDIKMTRGKKMILWSKKQWQNGNDSNMTINKTRKINSILFEYIQTL